MTPSVAPEGVLIVGATSSIARAVAQRFAARGAAIHLAARDAAELDHIARDLEVRHGAAVTWSCFDAADRSSHRQLAEDAERSLGHLGTVLVAVGTLGDQARAEKDVAHAEAIIDVNYTAPVSLLTHLANSLESRGGGTLACLLSVAGDRGRRSNYVYGSAKGGLDLFLEGLRARLWKAGTRVASIKLGFVDTKMSFGKKGMFLVATPDQAAAQIVRALDRRREVTYVPAFWRPVMLAIRWMPRSIFKRLPL